jgi:hypothetical protein
MSFFVLSPQLGIQLNQKLRNPIIIPYPGCLRHARGLVGLGLLTMSEMAASLFELIFGKAPNLGSARRDLMEARLVRFERASGSSSLNLAQITKI